MDRIDTFIPSFLSLSEEAQRSLVEGIRKDRRVAKGLPSKRKAEKRAKIKKVEKFLDRYRALTPEEKTKFWGLKR